MKLHDAACEYADIDPPFATEKYELTNRQVEKIKITAFETGAMWQLKEDTKEIHRLKRAITLISEGMFTATQLIAEGLLEEGSTVLEKK